jgi:hypothetical protein
MLIKRPIIASFLVAAVPTAAFLAYMLATTRNVDEKPFIVFFTLLAFALGWFLVWIFLGAIAWWQSQEEDARLEAERAIEAQNGKDQ